MTTIVQQILDAEKKADTIIKNAEKAKVRKVTKAREQSIEMLAQRKKEADKENDAVVKKEMKKIEDEKAEIAKTHQKSVENVEKSAKIEKGAQFVLKKLYSGDF